MLNKTSIRKVKAPESANEPIKKITQAEINNA
jgi:hypothetical protein